MSLAKTKTSSQKPSQPKAPKPSRGDKNDTYFRTLTPKERQIHDENVSRAMTGC